MSAAPYLDAAAVLALQERLREYSETYPDSEFLDSSYAYVQAGRPVSRKNAAMIEDALANWARRLRGPSWDPDRCPPGTDPHIWKLATHYRDAMEGCGWTVPSRRLIYAEIRRVIERDRLRENCAPWRDEPDAPGWYRMLRDVITLFCEEYTAVNALAAWYAHEQLSRPGEVAAITGRLKDQAKAARLEAVARPVRAGTPSAARRAAVRAHIAAVRSHG